MTAEKIRESVIAGSWYPDNPEALRREIGKYLDQASVSPIKGELLGLIVPHAGYIYSGGVAAHAYKLLRDHYFDRVLIVAPSHRAHFKGASVYREGGYKTPLGIVPLDHELISGLEKYAPFITYIPQAEAQEHSLEIQLPFLQTILKDFRLIPIIMGDQSFPSCQKLAHAIADVCKDRKVLLVASSDLSHYHPYREAKQMDQVVMDRVASFDPKGLVEELRNGTCEACGGGPMATIMLAAQELGANKAKVLHYANSGDVTGDTRGVVGYLAAAILNNPGAKAHKSREKGKVGVDLGLSREEKEILHEIAMQAIRNHCLGKPFIEPPSIPPKLQEKRGAFVCLHKGGDLRGCIGMIEGRAPLHQTVREMAVQAAFSDPRFCAVDSSELDRLDVEISVLTPLEKISDPAEIEIGKHGLLIKRGYRSGLLLPQVATDNGWGRIEFLEWTCRKAGLDINAWKEPDTEIYRFSADVF